ncbi:MAG: sigma 54-interacting transcriptional regulator [Planctomycetota bacterium]|nr:sigma 54-interacting transcriptional regulator [Planctomycetota bacterium]
MSEPTDNALPRRATEAILESISDGVFTVDHQWRITSFNRAAEEITGVPREEAVDRRCADVFRSSMCETACALRETMETGKPVVDRSAFIVDADGRRIPIIVSTALLRDEHGEVVGGVETFRDLSLVEELRNELAGRTEVGDLVSRSPAMIRIFDILPQAAASESTVLLQGETGTGKELLARAIHDLSPRAGGPFVPVNCGALPDTLLESELFGHKVGAFTGAVKDKPGRFALAEGGTVFLDEIGDVSPALQSRLLRVLEERSFEPLGGTGSVRADVRIIAATNRDLDALVEDGTFRRDLYYRVNVVRLQVPPLRDRKEDIPLLADHFVTRFNHLQEKAVTGISRDAMVVLMAHDYPGNVRELENVIERAFVLCDEGEIERRHLPEELIPRAGTREEGAASRGGDMASAVRAAETRAILDALQRNDYNRQAAARDLGMHKSTLFRKVQALGIRLPEQDGRSSQEG